MHKNINILFISSRADIGGGPLQMFDIISNVDRSRFTPFAALPDEEPFYDKLKSIGVKTLAIKKRAVSIIDFIGLVKFVYSNNIDVLHSHGKGAGIYSRLLRVFCPRVKVIHTFHGFHYDNMTQFKELAHKSVEKALARFTDKYVNVSGGEQLQYSSAGLLDYKKSVLIKNCVPLEKLRLIEKIVKSIPWRRDAAGPVEPASEAPAETVSRDLPRVALRFCAVARFDPVKQMPFMIESFVKAAVNPGPGERVKLIIIGGGEEFEQCRELVRLMNADSLIELPGERADALEIMAGCNIYVSASRREGLSMSMLEAIACGLPILAPRVAGIAELVRPYEKGVLFENNDYESFAAGMARIVENYNKIWNKDSGKENFAVRYEEHKGYIKKYEKLYTEVINGR